MDIRGRCDYVNNKKEFKTCPARIDTAVFFINHSDVYADVEKAKNKRSKNAIMRQFLLKTAKLSRPDANEAIKLYWEQNPEVVKPKRKYVRKAKPVVEKFYVSSGCMTKSFYKNYIKHEVSKIKQKQFEERLQDEEEDYIEYYRVGIDNPNDRSWEFTTLWFFDIGLERGYMPVCKSGINTSSGMAMSMCGMDSDEETTMTLEELVDFAPCGKSKESVKNLLLMKK